MVHAWWCGKAGITHAFSRVGKLAVALIKSGFCSVQQHRRWSACLVVLGVQVDKQELVARVRPLRGFLPAAGRPQRAGGPVALRKTPRETLRRLLRTGLLRALRQALEGACAHALHKECTVSASPSPFASAST